MHRHDLLHEFHVPHEPRDVVRHQLDRRHGAHAARVKRGGMDMPALHQAEHFPGHPAHLQRLAVELPGERVQRAHDVRDGAVAVLARVRGRRVFGFGQHRWVGFGDHLLAVVNADQILLEDVVVEHVLGSLAQVDDPFAEVRRLHPVGHVLRVTGAGRVVVATDSADPARDEVGVPGVLAAHEDGIAAENR